MYRNFVMITFLLVFGFFAETSGYKTGKDDPNRPSYIPENYIQVEAGNFREYFEWWAVKEGDSYKKTLTYTKINSSPIMLNSLTDFEYYTSYIHSLVYQIRDEDEYIFLIGTKNKGRDENYDLVNIKKPSLFITANNKDTVPNIFQHSFLCRKWWIVNETHVLDTRKKYDMSTAKGNAKTAMTERLIQQISTIPNDKCFQPNIVRQLSQCFNQNKYCAMDLDGPEPKLVISDEHVIDVFNGVQLIMRLRNDTGFVNLPHYVLKMGNLYFYFPENLQTGSENHKNPLLQKRVSLLPKFQRDDLFWQRALEIGRDINGNNPLTNYNGSLSDLLNAHGIFAGTIIINNPIVYAQNLYVNTRNKTSS